MGVDNWGLFPNKVLGSSAKRLADTASLTAAILNDRDLRTLTKTAAPSELCIYDANAHAGPE